MESVCCDMYGILYFGIEEARENVSEGPTYGVWEWILKRGMYKTRWIVTTG